MPNNSTFTPLAETPAHTDTSANKTHQALASTLLQIICNTPKALSIGLEGVWGSGKSTVIELLTPKLKDNNIGVFVFDAWAHINDPLRRVFLERLAEHFGDDEKVLRDIKDKILTQRKRLSIEDTRGPSWFRVFLLLSGLLVPLGLGLLSNVDADQYCWFCSATPYWELIVPLVIILLPFVSYALLVSLSLLLKKPEYLRLVDKGYRNEITDHAAYTEERTSIEFELWFSEIVDNALSPKGANDKIVIVIDNLDRVDASHLREIWSTLQAFFQHRNLSSKPNSTEQEWLDKLWFIVPYDIDHITQSFEPEKTIVLTQPDKLSEQSLSAKFSPVQGVSITQGFIHKNFQLVLDVPQPLKGDYKNLCLQLAKQSLHNLNETQQILVSDIFQYYLSSQSDELAPRAIRRYINHVGSLSTQWLPEMSLQAIATYAYLRGKHSVNEIKKLGFFSSSTLYSDESIGTDNITQELLAMLYGVPKARGYEMLLAGPLQAVFNNYDKDVSDQDRIKQFEDLLKQHGLAVWAAFHSPSVSLGIHRDKNFRHLEWITQLLMEKLSNHKQSFYKEIQEIRATTTSNNTSWGYETTGLLSHLELIAPDDNSDPFFVALKKWIENQTESALLNNDLDDLALTQLIQIANIIQNRNIPWPERAFTSVGQEQWDRYMNICVTQKTKLTFVKPNEQLITRYVDNTYYQNREKHHSHSIFLLATYYPHNRNWAKLLPQIIDKYLNNSTHQENPLRLWQTALALATHSAGTYKADFKKLIYARSSNFHTLDIEEQPLFILLAVFTFCSDYLAAILLNDTLNKCFDDNEKLRNEITARADTPETIETLWDFALDQGTPLIKGLFAHSEDEKLFRSKRIKARLQKGDGNFTDEEHENILDKFKKAQ